MTQDKLAELICTFAEVWFYAKFKQQLVTLTEGRSPLFTHTHTHTQVRADCQELQFEVSRRLHQRGMDAPIATRLAWALASSRQDNSKQVCALSHPDPPPPGTPQAPPEYSDSTQLPSTPPPTPHRCPTLHTHTQLFHVVSLWAKKTKLSTLPSDALSNLLWAASALDTDPALCKRVGTLLQEGGEGDVGSSGAAAAAPSVPSPASPPR